MVGKKHLLSVMLRKVVEKLVQISSSTVIILQHFKLKT